MCNPSPQDEESYSFLHFPFFKYVLHTRFKLGERLRTKLWEKCIFLIVTKLTQESDFNSLLEKIYLSLNLFHPTKHHSLCATRRKKGLAPPPIVSLLIRPLISFQLYLTELKPYPLSKNKMVCAFVWERWKNPKFNFIQNNYFLWQLNQKNPLNIPCILVRLFYPCLHQHTVSSYGRYNTFCKSISSQKIWISLLILCHNIFFSWQSKKNLTKPEQATSQTHFKTRRLQENLIL